MPDLRLGPALALALALAPVPAAAHPHVFIDGGVDLLFDAEGRLARLRVTWIYDPLTSIYLLEDLGLDSDAGANLAPAARARLAASQTEWEDGFEGDSYLWDGPRRVGLSDPREADAHVRSDGRVTIIFERAVATPFRPGPGTEVKVYDPTYYTAYAVTVPPAFEGGAAGCRAQVVPFEPSTSLAALQQRLAAIPIDASPEDTQIGAVFADRITIACD